VAVTALTQHLHSVQWHGSHCRHSVHEVLSAQALLVLELMTVYGSKGMQAPEYASHMHITQCASPAAVSWRP
jgi:hypothetical protein